MIATLSALFHEQALALRMQRVYPVQSSFLEGWRSARGSLVRGHSDVARVEGGFRTVQQQLQKICDAQGLSYFQRWISAVSELGTKREVGLPYFSPAELSRHGSNQDAQRWSLWGEAITAAVVVRLMEEDGADLLRYTQTRSRPLAEVFDELTGVQLEKVAENYLGNAISSNELSSRVPSLARQPESSDVYSASLLDSFAAADVSKAEVEQSVSSLVDSPTLANGNEQSVGESMVMRGEQVPSAKDRKNPVEVIPNADIWRAIDRQILNCRNEELALSLAVIVSLDSDVVHESHGVSGWRHSLSRVSEEVPTEQLPAECYFTPSGEVIFLLPGQDRTAAVQWVRDLLDAASRSTKLGNANSMELCGGLASVSVPTKGFQARSLIESASRCLDAARRQGAGNVKSIEVY